MYIKHFFLHYILENIYFLISLTGFLKTSTGIKFYQYSYEKYKILAEKKTLLQISSYIKTGSLAIDVGANIGVYAKIFSNAVGNEGKVIAIEPDPISLQVLARKLGRVSDSLTRIRTKKTQDLGVFFKQTPKSRTVHLKADILETHSEGGLSRALACHWIP